MRRSVSDDHKMIVCVYVTEGRREGGRDGGKDGTEGRTGGVGRDGSPKNRTPHRDVGTRATGLQDPLREDEPNGIFQSPQEVRTSSLHRIGARALGHSGDRLS